MDRHLCLGELLEKSLPKETEEKILSIILSHPEVSSPHNLRTRHIGNHIAIEVHIRMNGMMPLKEAHDITKKIEASLKMNSDRIRISAYIWNH